jgi:hypothetical protein
MKPAQDVPSDLNCLQVLLSFAQKASDLGPGLMLILPFACCTADMLASYDGTWGCDLDIFGTSRWISLVHHL